MTDKKEHACPVCGKMTTNKNTCSQKCYYQTLKNRTYNRQNKFDGLDDTNRCAQCHKAMPADRYSMYCEECEMHIEETY